jgi:muramoyltetrapeptide carboxypeptidase
MIEFDKAKDKLAIIAPASGCRDSQGQMDKAQSFARLQETISFFKQNDFKCIYDEQIFAGDSLEYFAAPREERIKQLKAALEDPDVKIISAFRGGYGCLDIVFDCLDIIPSGPKILIGFSDITILHLLFNQHYKFPSIHGVMNAQNQKMLGEVISVIAGSDISIELKSISSAVKGAKITGEMFGGNLAVLCSMIGTRLNPNTIDKILFLEDTGEKGYQIHRHLLHMYQAGLFNGVRGLVLGEFTESDQNIELSIKAFIDEYLPNIPVYKTNYIGHGQINHPIVIGAMGVIEDNRLTVSSPFKLAR